MQTRFILLFIVFVFGHCTTLSDDAKKAPDKTEFFMTTNRSGGIIESHRLEYGIKHLKDSKLVYEKKFVVAKPNNVHSISLYVCDGPANDDESIYYVLDSIGIIFSRSLVWAGHSSLSSTNDSINRLIDAAKDEIITDSNLQFKKPEIIFVKPK
jgi:hypothetical protein